MSDKRYEANIIRATAVEPANNLETTSAPGVWSIDEVVELQKKEKWPTVGNVATDVTDVFSTFLYDGNGSTQIIENGIALGNSNDGGSASFSASSTTRVNIATSANFNYGTGDFTIEAFVLIKSSKNYHNIYDQRTSTQDYNTNSPVIYIDSNNYIVYMVGGAGRAFSSALSLNTWYHVAVTKASGSTKLFLNGTQQGSAYSDSLTYVQPASDFSFGGSLEQNQYNTDGLISNLRVVKGTALYTSNFTAPTAELTAVSGTSLLTAQGSTPFVDNSGNNVTLTQQNGPVASELGPFTGTSGEGGLVWIKKRSGVGSHAIFDTARGRAYNIQPSGQDPQDTFSSTTGLTSFNSNGFSLGAPNYGSTNDNGGEYVSWTFRKQAKFFDVVTYSGNGATRTISHNLGSDVGMLMVKRTDASAPWAVWHRQLNGGTDSGQYYIQLNSTNAEAASSPYWNNTAPTSTEFTVSSDGHVNNASGTYVAYLFAHNNNDGEFGPDGDQDIIKCGSFTSDGTDTITLGFEPQWIIVKERNGTSGWYMWDTMRGWQVGDVGNNNDPYFYANSSNAESDFTVDVGFPTATGFETKSFGAGNYIYMAIRRGPLAEPTSATDVFAISTYGQGGSSAPAYTSGFPVDMYFERPINTSFQTSISSRFTAPHYMKTNVTDVEVADTNLKYDFMDGVYNATGTLTNYYAWMWKRAPSYFDVCCYSGTGSARTVSHNLGVAPEMMWVKARSKIEDWSVYHSGITNPEQNYLYLNENYAVNPNANTIKYWNHTNPTSSVFTVGDESRVNASGHTYVAYLFATVAGVSKVGSYTGDGTTGRVIDCGFTSGAKFVLIKPTSQTGSWIYYDTARGIVVGNDPFLQLNNTPAQVSNQSDDIDPDNSGFIVNQTTGNYLNQSSVDYIFYAIAT